MGRKVESTTPFNIYFQLKIEKGREKFLCLHRITEQHLWTKQIRSRHLSVCLLSLGRLICCRWHLLWLQRTGASLTAWHPRNTLWSWRGFERLSCFTWLWAKPGWQNTSLKGSVHLWDTTSCFKIPPEHKEPWRCRPLLPLGWKLQVSGQKPGITVPLSVAAAGFVSASHHHNSH